MSEVTGADLGQLDQLADAYQQRGAEIGARATDLNTRIVATIDAFRGALARLRDQTTTANTALVDDVDGLVELAAATIWTGANRAVFDADLATLRAGITAITESLLTRLSELERTGVEPFGGMLEDVGRQTVVAGTAAEQTGADMRVSLHAQRQVLQETADLGWAAV